MEGVELENTERPRASVARNAGIISLAVMASRVFGLVRDQVFAVFFGAGLQYDAFLTAFRDSQSTARSVRRRRAFRGLRHDLQSDLAATRGKGSGDSSCRTGSRP